MNRRDKRLDALLDRLVVITFTDGGVKTGVLEYGMQPPGSLPYDGYTLYIFGEGYLKFRKAAVRNIREY